MTAPRRRPVEASTSPVEEPTNPVSLPEQPLEEPANTDKPVSSGPGPVSVAETLKRVDGAWERFWATVGAFPPERVDEPVDKGGWTRKQMLAHIAAWHDLTSARLQEFAVSGDKPALEADDDALNARFARAAMGRSAGEVVRSVEVSFTRLRRQVESLSDEQLAAHDGWPAQCIAANTFEHYAEHIAELEPADGEAAPQEGR